MLCLKPLVVSVFGGCATTLWAFSCQANRTDACGIWMREAMFGLVTWRVACASQSWFLCLRRVAFVLLHKCLSTFEDVEFGCCFGCALRFLMACLAPIQWFHTNLVDPASSHMLVSKIKPCMSQYKLLYGETANGSLKQL